ncbi:hypothetical protein T492DRAFT_1085626 [Pavlovales sp. CCMP2436]|nr:hypothetical protein T492DRAFT_1085626 [Pavlovales sp. CCMP2436]|mmetsp:Transcript_14854/g.37579  ORF Transcript_14854/g.37579 Transcript_14854/m.37579 type:complete len:514 (+) Transcript_14854:115-1656(+)
MLGWVALLGAASAGSHLRFETHAGLSLVHSQRPGQVNFKPRAELAPSEELHWREAGRQLKLVGSELCLEPAAGIAWLRWLVTPRLTLTLCKRSVHQWASTRPLCDMRGTCYGARRRLARHPLPVRDKEKTLHAQSAGLPSLTVAFVSAALVAVLTALTASRLRARAPYETYETTEAEAVAAEVEGAERAAGVSPRATSSCASSASSSVGSPASFADFSPAPSVYTPRVGLSPIDERSSPGPMPLSELTQANQVLLGSVYKVLKPPRPPSASDTSSSGGSSITRPDHEIDENDARRKRDGFLVLRAPRPPQTLRSSSGSGGADDSGAGGKKSKKKKSKIPIVSDSASQQLMRAVQSAVEALSPSRKATREAYGLPPVPLRAIPVTTSSASMANQIATSNTPMKQPSPARQEPAASDSSSEDETQTAASGVAPYGYGLKGKLQESLLERSCRMHKPLAAGKTRCAACLAGIKQMTFVSPRVTFIECSGSCGRVWHPKCLPLGNNTRQRTFVCSEC